MYILTFRVLKISAFVPPIWGMGFPINISKNRRKGNGEESDTSKRRNGLWVDIG